MIICILYLLYFSACVSFACKVNIILCVSCFFFDVTFLRLKLDYSRIIINYDNEHMIVLLTNLLRESLDLVVVKTSLWMREINEVRYSVSPSYKLAKAKNSYISII